jgi:hypothetical protein
MKLTLNGEFEYYPFRCPVTGMLVTMGCRCHACRPDLHWLINTTAANPTHWTVLPTTTVAVSPGYAIQVGG